MGKDPAVLLYTGDFLSLTQGLTMAEIGQLIKLLCVQHQTGHLTKKAIKLSVGSVSRDVMKFFVLDENGLYYNELLENEIARRKKYSESRRKNIQKRYEKTSTYVDTSVLHMETETEAETETETKTGTEIETETGTETKIKTKTKTKIGTVTEAEDSKKKNKYGELENVELTDEEYEQLIKRFPKNYKRYIDDLSYYIASKDVKYKSHYAVILKWNRDNSDDDCSFDTDDFFQAALKRTDEYFENKAKENEVKKHENKEADLGW